MGFKRIHGGLAEKWFKIYGVEERGSGGFHEMLRKRIRCVVLRRYGTGTLKSYRFTYNCRMLVTNTASFSWNSVLFTNKISIHVRSFYVYSRLNISKRKNKRKKRGRKEMNCKSPVTRNKRVYFF